MLRAIALKFLELGTRTEPELLAIRVDVDGINGTVDGSGRRAKRA
jgi:hypothetical protein